MEENHSLFTLTIDPETKSHLLEMAKWTRFIAIAGMILLGLIFIIMILSVTVISFTGKMGFNYEQQEITNGVRTGTVLIGIVFIGLSFIPLYFLMHFSNKMKRALLANEQENLNIAFLNLKKYFRFIGILLIVVLSFYLLTFIVSLLTSL